jgi:hypothetical protein
MVSRALPGVWSRITPAAAYADLPWPPDPVGRLWHAATILREHRGDGHVAALLTAGVDGCESLVWRVGLDGERLREVTQPARGWTDDEWQAASRRLEQRGWLTAEGVATPAARRPRLAGAAGRQPHPAPPAPLTRVRLCPFVNESARLIAPPFPVH